MKFCVVEMLSPIPLDQSASTPAYPPSTRVDGYADESMRSRDESSVKMPMQSEQSAAASQTSGMMMMVHVPQPEEWLLWMLVFGLSSPVMSSSASSASASSSLASSGVSAGGGRAMFSPHVVLQRFQHFGDIEDFVVGSGNWMFLRFVHDDDMVIVIVIVMMCMMILMKMMVMNILMVMNLFRFSSPLQCEAAVSSARHGVLNFGPSVLVGVQQLSAALAADLDINFSRGEGGRFRPHVGPANFFASSADDSAAADSQLMGGLRKRGSVERISESYR